MIKREIGTVIIAVMQGAIVYSNKCRFFHSYRTTAPHGYTDVHKAILIYRN
jgi:hypothetical protein